MGGLSAALALAQTGFEEIHIYETASNLGFVGAGIQMAPNMSRILDRLGVWKEIQKEATFCRDTSVRGSSSLSWTDLKEKANQVTAEGASDKELAHVELDYVEKTYGYRHMVGHRATLAGGLYEGCKKEKAIQIHFATSIGEVISWSPNPTFIATPRNGEPYQVSCDILLAADGVKSIIRRQMLKLLNHSADVQDTDQASYRILLKRSEIEHDPELMELMNGDTVSRWIGAKRHIIAYPISNHTIYNISTAQPDTNFAAAPSETYTTKGSKPAMLSVFADFCPKIQRMLNLVPDGEVCEWKLRVHAPLPTWIHGHVALVGDACHPTLPHLAQGAAQAIEDSAVLGVLLGKIKYGKKQGGPGVGEMLKLYEDVRKDRAEMLVEWAAEAGRNLHLGSGKAQEERNRQFEELKKKGGKAKNPEKWADGDVQNVAYGVDIASVAEEQFRKRFGSGRGST